MNFSIGTPLHTSQRRLKNLGHAIPKGTAGEDEKLYYFEFLQENSDGKSE
jgi:hypothetical protein